MPAKTVRPEDLLGLREVMEMLGISRQRIHQLEVGGSFPEPIVRLACGPIWHRPEVERWSRNR